MTSTSPPALGLMIGQLTEATSDLFAQYDLPLRTNLSVEDLADEAETSGMAVIGYAGAGVRGALIMVVPERAIYSWMAAAGVPDGEVADTLGEFSNMLLGRLKERLMPLGISITATTPTAAIGQGLRLSDSPGPSACRTFDGPNWNLRVRLDAQFDAGFEPLERSLPEWQPKAGDVIDFDEMEVNDK
jgi:CheY-specific phosphatase CheX